MHILTKCRFQEAKSIVKNLVRQCCAEGLIPALKGYISFHPIKFTRIRRITVTVDYASLSTL
jgi:hypothetical protein